MAIMHAGTRDNVDSRGSRPGQQSSSPWAVPQFRRIPVLMRARSPPRFRRERDDGTNALTVARLHGSTVVGLGTSLRGADGSPVICQSRRPRSVFDQVNAPPCAVQTVRGVVGLKEAEISCRHLCSGKARPGTGPRVIFHRRSGHHEEAAGGLDGVGS